MLRGLLLRKYILQGCLIRVQSRVYPVTGIPGSWAHLGPKHSASGSRMCPVLGYPRVRLLLGSQVVLIEKARHRARGRHVMCGTPLSDALIGEWTAVARPVPPHG
jgi:hypothetical protein